MLRASRSWRACRQLHRARDSRAREATAADAMDGNCPLDRRRVFRIDLSATLTASRSHKDEPLPRGGREPPLLCRPPFSISQAGKKSSGLLKHPGYRMRQSNLLARNSRIGLFAAGEPLFSGRSPGKSVVPYTWIPGQNDEEFHPALATSEDCTKYSRKRSAVANTRRPSLVM